MANHQKFIKYLLSFVIAFSPVLLINSANASTVGGWSMSNPVAQGASTVYEGTKKVIIDGKDYIKKGTAIVTPTARSVAKVLAKGVAGVALSFAVEQLIGAVDWVLDPANNRIKYYADDGFTYIDYTSGCSGLYNQILGNCIASSLSSKQNVSMSCKTTTWISGSFRRFNCTFPVNGTDRVYGDVNVAKKGVASDREEKFLPLPTVAQQVISNAEGNTDKKAGAQVATTAAAADIVAEAEKDDAKARPIAQQLESSAETKPADEAAAEKANEANGKAKPNEANPEATDLSITFPIFCNWAPTICEAASTVIKLPTTISEYWEYIKTKTSEWENALEDFFKETNSDQTEIDIPTPVSPDIDTNINFSSACPANYTLANFSYHGFSQNWEVDFSKFCDVFGTYVKPVVIAMGAFTAALIIGGVRTNE